MPGIFDAGKAAQKLPDLFGVLLEPIQFRPDDADLDVGTDRPRLIALEGDTLNPGHGLQCRPDFIPDLLGRTFAHAEVLELHVDQRGDIGFDPSVRSRVRQVDADLHVMGAQGILIEAAHVHPDVGLQALEFVGFDDAVDGVLDLLGQGVGVSKAIGIWAFNVDQEPIRLDVGELGVRHPGEQEGQRDQKNTDRYAGHQVAIPHAPSEQDVVAIQEGMPVFCVVRGVAQLEDFGRVRRQDQEGFQQGAEQCRDHHDRDHRDELAEDSGDAQQGEKRRDRGEDRGQHRPHDLPRADVGGLVRLHPFLHMAVGVFGDDDGVVHDQPEHDQERKHADHVDAVPEHGHHDHGGQHGHGNPQGGDQGHPEIEKEVQREEQQHQRHDAGGLHGVNAGFNQPRHVHEETGTYAFGQRKLHDLFANPGGDVESGSVGTLGDVHVDRRHPVEAPPGDRLFQLHGYPAQIADPQLAALRVVPHHDLADGLDPFCAEAAKHDFAFSAANDAAWRIAQVAAQGRSDFVQRHPARGQFVRIQLHPRLPVPIAGHADAGHPGNLLQVSAQPVGHVV